MKRAIVIIVILILAGAAVGVGWWYINENPDLWSAARREFDSAVQGLGLGPAEEPEGLVASGFIEADEASVTTEIGGRIVALHASEGDEVEEGEVMVRLDDSLLLAQIEMAEADLAVAESSLALVKANVREETLDHAEAMVRQAETGQAAARQAWDDAQALMENPQELELAITEVQGQLGVLDYQVKQAQGLANAAQVGRDLADQVVRLLEDFDPVTVHMPVGPGVAYEETIKIRPSTLEEARVGQAEATYQSWEAWTGVDQAKAARAGLERYLAELRQQAASPVSLEAQVNAARSQYEVATAAVALAEAQVEGLKMGATPEQIAAVEAQVEIARTALEALYVQGDQFTLYAPISGLVLERPVHVGEVAVPGAPLMTLADLDRVTLTIYVPEDQLGQVQLGQPVWVSVDAYPGRRFEGTVALIASEAEFTPKNVQTREERVNMVFAVKVRVPNADHALKPGMPADALIPDEVLAE